MVIVDVLLILLAGAGPDRGGATSYYHQQSRLETIRHLDYTIHNNHTSNNDNYSNNANNTNDNTIIINTTSRLYDQ